MASTSEYGLTEGGENMKIIDWLGNKFSKLRSGKTVVFSEYREESADKMTVEAFALFSTIELIADILSKCEIRTFSRGKEVKGDEWYCWNVRPNKNQSAAEFWKEYVTKLLYYGNVLVIEVGGQRVIADNFHIDERAVADSIITDVSRGALNFNRSFQISDVILTRYSNNDSKSLISGILAECSRLAGKAGQRYVKTGGQKGILDIPAAAQGDIDFERKFKDLMENRFKSFFDAENSVLPLWNNMRYTAVSSVGKTSNVSEVNDFSLMLDEALKRSAQVYCVPPALMKGDVAGIKEVLDLMLTVCIDPIAKLISDSHTAKIYTPKDVITGSYMFVDTSNVKHMDIFEMAANVDKLIACGLYSLNELRKKLREEKIHEKWADKHFITKNYQEMSGVQEVNNG